MSMNVWVKCGRVFNLLDSATATGAADSIYKDSTKATFQAYGSTSAGTGSVTVAIQLSNDNTHWVTFNSISLTLGTTDTTDGFSTDEPWKYVRANVTEISGTGATVSVLMGV